MARPTPERMTLYELIAMLTAALAVLLFFYL